MLRDLSYIFIVDQGDKVNVGYGNGSLHNDTEIYWDLTYCKTSNISRTLAGNIIVDHSDVVGASPVGAAPTISSFSTWHLASRGLAKPVAGQYQNLSSVGIWCDLY